MAILAARRAARYPALQSKLQHLALPLAPLVQVNTGRVHSAFPKSLLQFGLLTDDQLDSIAHFYHQRTPGRWSRRYPCPVTWPKGQALEEKRRKLGKFIGLRGCDTPTPQGIQSERGRQLGNTGSTYAREYMATFSDTTDVEMTDVDEGSEGSGYSSESSSCTYVPSPSSPSTNRSTQPPQRPRLVRRRSTWSLPSGSAWRAEQNARIAARPARFARQSPSRHRRTVRTVRQSQEQQQSQQSQQSQQGLLRRAMTVEEVIEEARRAQLEHDANDGALRRKLGQFD